MAYAAADYTALLTAVARRALGPLGVGLGAAMAVTLPGAKVTTPARLSFFVGQTCHETEGFLYMSELGPPTYFAKYDHRADLGNRGPPDGYRYRGRGIIQVTGRANYRTYGQRLGLDLLSDPDLAMEPSAAVAIAALYWTDHGLNALADAGDVEGVTRRINGGLNGLDERVAMTARAQAWLAAHPDPAGAQAAHPAPAPPTAPQGSST